MSKYNLLTLYFLLFVSIGMASYAIFKTPNSINPISNSIAGVGMLESMPRPSRDSLMLFDLPAELSFAGEKVPLEIPDVKERLEREIYVNAYWQSNMILLMKRSSKFIPKIETILKENGVPDDFKYLAMAESGLMNVASPAGARGFWQFMESTGKEYGLEISKDVDERYHLEKATIAASKYLKKAHNKFGDWTSVAASYNMGQSGFARRQSEQLQTDYYDLHLNDETSRYMFRILAFKVIFENPGAFGFHLRESDYYNEPEMKSIHVTSDIKNLANWAKEQGSTYKELKLYNPWLRDKDLNVRRGRSYDLILPK
ncbi:lytic transglycosylase domain-containing protein [Algoriphagus sp. SE2]|uniref:lytic transglycosylase domain-containing protein n=1 Tax=Algoriphagus sp. SE2 TaxID=3141536 RepID=UPI0031CD6EB5